MKIVKAFCCISFICSLCKRVISGELELEAEQFKFSNSENFLSDHVHQPLCAVEHFFAVTK